ncbi:MAG: hypothetical protein U0795_01420 [Pirellulales bacterium]
MATLFLVSIAVLGALGWISSARRESYRQKLIGETLKTGFSATVLFGGPFDEYGVDQQCWWRRVAKTVLGERVLDVSLCYSSDSLRQIARLQDLQDLYVIGFSEHVEDLSPLAGLTSLNNLWLQDLHVKNISGLGPLENLESLALYVDGLSDIRPLAGLKRLRYLYISAPVSDLTPLSELHALTELELNPIATSDLRPLAKLQNLTELRILSMTVADLSPIAKLSNLRSLNINGTAVLDVTPILGLTQLNELTAREATIDAEQWKRIKDALPKCKTAR